MRHFLCPVSKFGGSCRLIIHFKPKRFELKVKLATLRVTFKNMTRNVAGRC
jgi:hypothetical protein